MNIPNGWKEERLGNLLIEPIKNGFSPLCQENETGKWVLSLGALTGDSFNANEKKCIPNAVVISNNFLLKYGDILISRSNTLDKVGRAAMFRNEIQNCYYPDLMMRVRIDNAIVLPEYLEKILQSSLGRTYFEKNAAGTSISMVKINKSVVENFSFSLPPLVEQQKIARILCAWDAAIEKTETLVAEKERAYSFYVREFIEEPTAKNMWQIFRLTELLSEGSKIAVADTSKYKKITVKLHKAGLAFFESERKMADTRPFYIRHTNELIIGKQNYFNGSIALVSPEFDNCICSNAIMSFKISPKANAVFLFEALSYNAYLKRHEAFANGTGQKELSESEFLNFTVSLPPLSEQEKVAAFLTSAKKEIALLRSLAGEYRKQKQWLMQNLLTGTVRVK